MQLAPKRIVGLLGVPQDRFGVAQRRFLAAVEPIGFLEPEQLAQAVVRIFLRPTGGALVASVVAVQAVRDVSADQFLEVVLHEADFGLLVEQ